MSFKQRCENDRCIGYWAAHVREGRFGSVELEDRNVVRRIYIDDQSSGTERDALEAIFSGRAGGPWETLGQFVATRLETRFVPTQFDETDDEKRMHIPDVFNTTVTAVRGRDGAGHAVLSNLYNVIHGATHVLARGNTTCTDDRLGFDIQGTHGLFSEFQGRAGSR